MLICVLFTTGIRFLSIKVNKINTRSGCYVNLDLCNSSYGLTYYTVRLPIRVTKFIIRCRFPFRKKNQHVPCEAVWSFLQSGSALSTFLSRS